MSDHERIEALAAEARPVLDRLLASEMVALRLRLVAADLAEILYDKSPPDEDVVDWWRRWLVLYLGHHGLTLAVPEEPTDE